jgi:hypothetical protein
LKTKQQTLHTLYRRRQQQINRPDSIAQHSRQPTKQKQTADKQTADSSRLSDSRSREQARTVDWVARPDPYHTREGRELRR